MGRSINNWCRSAADAVAQATKEIVAVSMAESRIVCPLECKWRKRSEEKRGCAIANWMLAPREREGHPTNCEGGY